MTLRYDPLQVFKASTTPAGLYARQKWLNEQQTPQWQHAFESTVALLTKNQEAAGSWGASAIVTVKHLFGLHLTVRQPTPQITRALDWLLKEARCQLHFNEGQAKKLTEDPIPLQLPFIAGRQDGFILGATLFLASIFGWQNHSQILTLFQRLDQDAHKNQFFWKDLTCFNNILRAFVVHPTYAKQTAVRAAVERLGMCQTNTGDWGPELPFYQIVNALAHLGLPEADQQLERAFHHLVQLQRPDGTWSTDQPEWHTFLVVHALKNKNRL
jgi:hypothetical protein